MTSGAKRIDGLDVARALAGLIMLQGHAYDGWVSSEAKSSVAYALTRFLGTFPLPAFFVLAGASVALRLHIAHARHEAPSDVRRGVIYRGLSVVLWGYGVSLLYALIDGSSGLPHLLRADVLHAIGLSIVLTTAVCLTPSASNISRISVRWHAAALLTLSVLVAPFLARLTHDLSHQNASSYVIALFSQVDGITRMPALPLVGWSALGLLAMDVCLSAEGGRPQLRLGRMAACMAVGVGCWLTGEWLTHALLETSPGKFDRTHIALWANMIDLGGRGLIVLSLGCLLAPQLGRHVMGAILPVGRSSLFVYVLHIPFCYGLLGLPLRGKLGMLEASVAVAALIAACTLLAQRKETLARARANRVNKLGRQAV